MDIPTVPGSLYTVATKTTCDITDTATGTPIDSASAGSVTFTAQGSVTTLSDSEATYTKVNFKNAAAALRMLGGGYQLPSGYLSAAFLEATGSQRLKLGVTLPGTAEYDLQFTSFASDNQCMGFNYSYAKWGVLSNKQYRLGPKSNTLPEYAEQRQNVKFTVLPSENKITLQVNSGTIYEYERSSIATAGEWCLWQATDDNTTNCNARIWKFNLKSLSGEKLLTLVPCLSANGTACFYDFVQKKSFFDRSLVVGMTLAQARQLSKLPAGGGKLKISIPENYTDDEAVVAALSTATGNGWVFEIQTYTTDGAEASTFSLRRIWVRKTADPDGAYVAATGERWHVEWCQTVLGAETSDLGYEPFRSVDVALAEWELTPYIFPEEETLSI